MMPTIEYSGGISEGRKKMLVALSKAKSELYEARHWAKQETAEEMADRIWAVFNDAERLFLDERKDQWGIMDATEEELTRAYGPRIDL